MAKVKKTAGGGMFARNVVAYTDADMAPAFRAWADRWNAALGEGGGQFGAAVINAERRCRLLLDVVGPFQPADRAVIDAARAILRAIEATRSAIAAGDADSAARWALDVGRLVTEASAQGRWGGHAARGSKNAAVLQSAATRSNAERGRTAERDRIAWQALADQLWEAHPGMFISDVARTIAKRLGGKPGTIRKKIRPPLHFFGRAH